SVTSTEATSESETSATASEETTLEEVSEYKEPNTEKEYFQQASRASRLSEEADNIRIYTPHANVKKNIPTNGYGTAQFGVHLDVDVQDEDAKELMSNLGMDDKVSLDLSLNAKKVPFDYRDTNRNAEDTSKRIMSFVNEIEDEVSQVDFSLGDYTLTSSSVYTAIHQIDNALFVDLAWLDGLYSTLTASHLPGNGRVSFNLSEPQEFFDELIEGIVSLEEEEASEEADDSDDSEEDSDDGYSLGFGDFDFGALDFLSDIDLTEVFEALQNISYELYLDTKTCNWTFADNTISISIEGEEQLKAFMLSLYDANDEEKDATDRSEYSANIDRYLDMLVFDHAKGSIRFSEKGLEYENYSFLISSFDKDKILDEIGESSVKAYPVGAYGLSYGLAYEYDNVTPDQLSPMAYSKYTAIDREAVVTKILDLIRSLIPVGFKF
ncbi:MAG: hypothetical protein K6B65_02790, partial [Bacilli bacterium]|nr:hypothetical protein [Bacilli bacterium]